MISFRILFNKNISVVCLDVYAEQKRPLASKENTN